MRRHAFGIFALIFVIAGVYFALQPPRETTQWFYGVLLRVGLVLGALWLAYPELSRVPPWLFGVLAVAIGIVMVRPRLIIIVAPAVVAIWILRPRKI